MVVNQRLILIRILQKKLVISLIITVGSIITILLFYRCTKHNQRMVIGRSWVNFQHQAT